MRNTVRLKLECATFVMAFCRRYPALDLMIQELEQRLGHLLAQAITLMEQEQIALEGAETAARERDELALELKERFDVFLPFAATAAHDHGISELRLRVPYRAACPGLFIRAARHAIDTAIPHKALLVQHGMPHCMLDFLSASFETLQAAHGRRLTSTAVYGATAADLAALSDQVMPIIKHLDALNRARFQEELSCLVEWRAASTVKWGKPVELSA